MGIISKVCYLQRTIIVRDQARFLLKGLAALACDL
jgi:hypothetical protein